MLPAPLGEREALVDLVRRVVKKSGIRKMGGSAVYDRNPTLRERDHECQIIGLMQRR
jgi:hypothetical protein